MPWNDRAAIFLKAADLVSGKYRYKLLAATILGQGKNAWQAEIDAAAEVCDTCDLPIRCTNVCAPAQRLSQIRSQICGGVVFPTASKEQRRSMEVGVRVQVLSIPTNICYSRVEYRALEGFVLAVSPFNFTAIGGNLPGG